MKKTPLFITILTFLVFSLAGIAYSWQGRMAGMGAPYGLIMDESDFLIHPAGIAKGQGINFYGHYRYDWREVTDWNYTVDTFDSTGLFLSRFPYRTSGHEWKNDALLGAAFPMGPGRMGLFFEYEGKRGDFHGRNNEFYAFLGSFFDRYSLDSDLDRFALRLLYGLPMGGFKLGGEIQLAYRNEKNETFLNGDWNGTGPRAFYTNYPLGGESQYWNLFPFMFPYDSKYWEALLKGSIKGAIGPVKTGLTVRGGVIFGGDNKYDAKGNSPAGISAINMRGDVDGWRLGGDLWLRYPLKESLSLPFLFRVDYLKKTRDGDGSGFGPDLIVGIVDYKNKETIFQMEVGGGVDKEFAKGTRVAAGIYYDYIQNKNKFSGSGLDPATGDFTFINYSKYPDHTEHQIILRLAGEKEITPMFAMRMGLNLFYGWVKEDFGFRYLDSTPNDDTTKSSLDGSHWGIGAWLGGTVKFPRFSLEPFVGGGYQKLGLDGNGTNTEIFPIGLTEWDKTRKEWFIGGGFSVKF